MAYESTGMQAMFPVYLPRLAPEGARREEYDAAVAANETNLNQNLENLFQKIARIEAHLGDGGA